MVAFVISHWEKYNTGVLYLPWAYDLSQVVCYCIMYFNKFLSFDKPYLKVGYALVILNL